MIASLMDAPGGGFPSGGMVADSSGVLFGTAPTAALYDSPVVAGLLVDNSGNIYGVASQQWTYTINITL